MNLLAVVASLAIAGTGQTPVKATIQKVAWMAGSWSCPMWGGTFEEHWSQPRGGTMVGMGRLSKPTQTDFMEFLSIEPDKGGLTMWILLDAPSKGDKKPVPFKLTSVTAQRAVWENPANDFPAKITYSKAGSGRMNCRISGKQGGKDAHEDFAFKKMK